MGYLNSRCQKLTLLTPSIAISTSDSAAGRMSQQSCCTLTRLTAGSDICSRVRRALWSRPVTESLPPSGSTLATPNRRSVGRASMMTSRSKKAMSTDSVGLR